MDEKDRVASVDIEEWPIAILVISEEHPKTVLHAVLYQTSPNDIDLVSLKKEFIEEFKYEGDTDKLQYTEVPSEELMKMLGLEVKDDN